MTKDKTILIQNIYYMLAYAFRMPQKLRYREGGAEAFEDLPNLFAALLARGLVCLRKRGLRGEYCVCQEELPLLRGKLLFSESMKLAAAGKSLLSCTYDEFTENHIYHQILKATAQLLLRQKEVKAEYQAELRRELRYFEAVDALALEQVNWERLHVEGGGLYPFLLGLCRLLAEGLLMKEETGEYQLVDFLNEQKMSRLYEKFILEYYRKKFPQLSVRAAKIPWAVDDGVRSRLPLMQSDITLQRGNKLVIIDAKYYSHRMQRHYQSETIHSGNLYQIFTYVKNRSYAFGEEKHQVSGMLLYAATEEEIQPDCVYQMHGNQISVKTLDLNVPFVKIEVQLQKLLEEAGLLTEEEK